MCNFDLLNKSNFLNNAVVCADYFHTPTKRSNAQHLVENNCSMKNIKNQGMSCNSLWIPYFVVLI